MFLDRLQASHPSFRPRTFVIDCSSTEVAAIKASFPSAIILWCLFHFFKAIRSNIADKVCLSLLRSKQSIILCG